MTIVFALILGNSIFDWLILILSAFARAFFLHES